MKVFVKSVENDLLLGYYHWTWTRLKTVYFSITSIKCLPWSSFSSLCSVFLLFPTRDTLISVSCNSITTATHTKGLNSSKQAYITHLNIEACFLTLWAQLITTYVLVLLQWRTQVILRAGAKKFKKCTYCVTWGNGTLSLFFAVPEGISARFFQLLGRQGTS